MTMTPAQVFGSDLTPREFRELRRLLTNPTTWKVLDNLVYMDVELRRQGIADSRGRSVWWCTNYTLNNRDKRVPPTASKNLSTLLERGIFHYTGHHQLTNRGRHLLLSRGTSHPSPRPFYLFFPYDTVGPFLPYMFGAVSEWLCQVSRRNPGGGTMSGTAVFGPTTSVDMTTVEAVDAIYYYPGFGTWYQSGALPQGRNFARMRYFQTTDNPTPPGVSVDPEILASNPEPYFAAAELISHL